LGGNSISTTLEGNGIGLSLEESPLVPENGTAVFEKDGVYVLRASAASKHGVHAISSAMFAVAGTGVDVYWSSADATESEVPVREANLL